MEKISFYDLGRKDVNDMYVAVSKRREEIEKKYGKSAAEQYLIGVSSEIEQFLRMDTDDVSIEQAEYATTNFGAENTRNNSYFGGQGTGPQYRKIDSYGFVRYIEPKTISKRH